MDKGGGPQKWISMGKRGGGDVSANVDKMLQFKYLHLKHLIDFSVFTWGTSYNNPNQNK